MSTLRLEHPEQTEPSGLPNRAAFDNFAHSPMELNEQYKYIETLCEDALIADAFYVRERLKKLWPPQNPRRVQAILKELEIRLRKSKERLEARMYAAITPKFPENLPISARAEEVIALIKNHPVLVLAGETGSGKTTQIPKMCLAAGLGRRGLIGCTQPRRIAALSVAQRVAEELDTTYGETIGCKIRFSDKTSPKTRVKFMTDGILLNELQNDPLLLAYECLIIDEAHERSLNIDFILGALRNLRTQRPDLKIIVTSATIDTESFSKAFESAPVVTVSGRTYPVEIRYRPLETDANEDGEISYISSSAIIAEEILQSQAHGDILIFMPTEKDIRDTTQILEKRIPERRAQILPLFGRMAAGEQQAIFSSSQRTKIIVATNIAETSITIPGIRYVIDSGLARISRFSPHTATRRLPVEPISQCSAKQRAGRSGRVQNGVCYRLYEERDFESRPEFATPEILRANLADVILRMTAFRLGSMDTFPFIEAPDPKSIRGGYRILEELGAIERKSKEHPWALTELGKRLGRLPVDPSIGRMILAAEPHRCIAEILIIASALSIQDPREMPADKREAAKQAQRVFADKDSDFLAFLNIWRALSGVDNQRPSNRILKQFCSKYFLSFLRMREWMEIHQQLSTIAKDYFGKIAPLASSENVLTDAVHQAILTGCIGNIAQKEEGNQYRATHGRKISLFPGSNLYDRKFAARERPGSKKKVNDTTRHGATPEWIVCAEWLETSRLFARTCAKILPEWISEIVPHLIKRNYSEPGYQKKSGRVIVREKSLLYGLIIDTKQVSFHSIDPEAATEIFIRDGIIANELPMCIQEVETIHQVVNQAEEILARKRQSATYSIEERLFTFLTERLPKISDVHSLKRWVREQCEQGHAPLAISHSHLLADENADQGSEDFPAQVQFADSLVDVTYTYKPGEDSDGATLKIGLDEFHKMNQGILDWVIPGYVEERIEHLIRALPKEIRRQLFPIAENTRAITQRVKPSPQPLTEILSKILWEDFRIRVGVNDWNLDRVPEHLRPRVEITDKSGKNALASGRNWESVQTSYQTTIKKQTREGSGVDKFKAWKNLAKQWERPASAEWPDLESTLPPSILVCTVDEVPVMAFPALKSEENGVAIRLLKSQAEADNSNRIGMGRLVEFTISRELAWLQKDLRDIKKIGPAVASFSTSDAIRAEAYNHIRNHLLFDSPIEEVSKSHFQQRCAFATNEIKGIAYKMIDTLGPILELRHEILTTPAHYPEFHQDMVRVAPKDFLKRTPFNRLAHIERYLKGYLLRNKRAKTNLPKDREKLQRVAAFHEQLIKLIQKAAKKPSLRAPIQTLFWMLEEYRISLFCQELGTAEKISEKRLEQQLDQIRNLNR